MNQLNRHNREFSHDEWPPPSAASTLNTSACRSRGSSKCGTHVNPNPSALSLFAKCDPASLFSPQTTHILFPVPLPHIIPRPTLPQPPCTLQPLYGHRAALLRKRNSRLIILPLNPLRLQFNRDILAHQREQRRRTLSDCKPPPAYEPHAPFCILFAPVRRRSGQRPLKWRAIPSRIMRVEGRAFVARGDVACLLGRPPALRRAFRG